MESGTPAFMRIFTLWANNMPYPMDGPTFSKMSKKCGKMLSQGQTQGTLIRRVRNDTVQAFVAACQLQPFKVNRNNAFELLDISKEWEVATLVKFVNDYINSHNLTRANDVDCIADLIKHCNKKSYLESDVIAISNMINTALTDPRLLQAPPELIFRALLAAEQRSIDQVGLIDFVITLFNENTKAAVPLVTLIDFARMTHDQNEGVFQCPELHEENYDFFLSWALSSTRKSTERERVQSDSRHYAEVSTMRELIMKSQVAAVLKIKTEHDEKLEEMREKVKKQQEEIDGLIGQTEKQAEQLEKKEKDHNQKLDEVDDKIAQMKKAADEYEEMIRNIDQIIRDEVAEEISPIRAAVGNQMNDTSDLNAEELHKLKESYDKPIEDNLERSDKLNSDLDESTTNLTIEKERLIDAKATLAIKIVNDTLRYQKYIREKEQKFALFDKRKPLWDVSGKEAREADQRITELSKKLRDLCPLDGFE